MSYDLTIEFDPERSASADLAAIETFLDGYPGTKRAGDRFWIHELPPQIHIGIDLPSDDADDAQRFRSIGIHVPYPCLSASGHAALQLSFELAQLLGWRVFDDQIGEYIEHANMEKLLRTPGQFGDAADHLLAAGKQNWAGRWAAAATQQSRLFLVFAVGISTGLAVVLLLLLDVQPNKFGEYLPWVGLPIGLAVFTLKVIFDAWLGKRRRGRSDKSELGKGGQVHL